MFASCLGAISGIDNRLGFKRGDRVVAILVDGLGSHNIRFGAGHASNLNRLLVENSSIHAGFPSTTAASITSFGTGLRPGEHGIVGYKVLDRTTGQAINQLTGWSKTFDPLEWQPNQTISQRAADASISAFVVGPAEYAKSGFTTLTMRGATYVAAKTIFDRVEIALDILAKSQPSLTYLYVPELDQKAHAFGVDSSEWLGALEELESAVSTLEKQLNTKRYLGAAAIVTADHGVIDVPSGNHVFLDEFALAPLKLVAGDPRANYLYFEQSLAESELKSMADDLQTQLNQTSLGSGIKIATKQQLIDASWFGPTVTSVAASRMPDLFAIATNRSAIYHREFAPAKSQNMIGQHGGISAEELSIPLIRMGAFSR